MYPDRERAKMEDETTTPATDLKREQSEPSSNAQNGLDDAPSAVDNNGEVSTPLDQGANIPLGCDQVIYL